MAKTVITTIGKNKILKARAGISALSKIKYMAFGDGGENDPASAGDNALSHELLRKEIDGYSIINETRFRFSSTIATDELANTTINEFGLIDADGDFVIIRNTADKIKDGDEEMRFDVDDMF